MDLNVGDTVWLARAGEVYGVEDGLSTTVSKVSRKYFEVDALPRPRFFLGNGAHDNGEYGSRWQIYLSKADHEKALEDKAMAARKKRLAQLIHEKTSWRGDHEELTLEQIEKAAIALEMVEWMTNAGETMATPEQRTVTLRATFDIEITLDEAGFEAAESEERKNAYTLDGGLSLADISDEDRNRTIASYVIANIGISAMHGDMSGRNPIICLGDREGFEKVSFEEPYVVLVDGDDKEIDLGLSL